MILYGSYPHSASSTHFVSWWVEGAKVKCPTFGQTRTVLIFKTKVVISHVCVYVCVGWGKKIDTFQQWIMKAFLSNFWTRVWVCWIFTELVIDVEPLGSHSSHPATVFMMPHKWERRKKETQVRGKAEFEPHPAQRDFVYYDNWLSLISSSHDNALIAFIRSYTIALKTLPRLVNQGLIAIQTQPTNRHVKLMGGHNIH